MTTPVRAQDSTSVPLPLEPHRVVVRQIYSIDGSIYNSVDLGKVITKRLMEGWILGAVYNGEYIFVKKRPQWQYKRVRAVGFNEIWEPDDKRVWERFLNNQGVDGWELIQIKGDEFIFKREY